LIYVFYALAVLAVVAILVPIKWPRTATTLAIVTLVVGFTSLGVGGYMYSGKIRHREFRYQPPPNKSDRTTLAKLQNRLSLRNFADPKQIFLRTMRHWQRNDPGLRMRP
jgi:hypothetical protein